jgi:putative oxidoreductase
MILTIANWHNAAFTALEKLTSAWLPGLFARFAFASVLLSYYWASASTKIAEGAFGFLTIADTAYYQIVPGVVEAAGFDVAQIATFPWAMIVRAGTYTEFVLPLLIVLGLFTRLASLGMIGFIAVQSFVDVRFHDVGVEATGALFDRFPDAAILDQRLMWLVPLVYLVIKGAGAISLDGLFGRLNPQR